MINVSDKRYTTVYQDNTQLQNLSKKSQSFLDQNSNSDGPGFVPDGPWNQPLGQGLGPVDYTNTASEPYSTGVDPTMGMLNTPMLPVGLLLNYINFGINPAAGVRVEPTTVEEAEPSFLKTVNDYTGCCPEFDKLTEEQRARVMASALEGLGSLKMQQAGFQWPFQKMKAADFFAVGDKQHKMGCSFGHGVITTVKDSKEYASITSQILEGHQVKGCHWQFMAGLKKHFDTLKGKSNPNIEGVVKLFNEHFDEYGDDVPYIHICHSEGSNTADQAIKRMPESRRKNIHIIAVGPSKCIDPELCGSVFNIINENDNITKKFDEKGYEKAVLAGNIRIVPEDPSVGPVKAHRFKNPKTLGALEEELKKLLTTLNTD